MHSCQYLSYRLVTFILLVFATSSVVIAQYGESIRSDRPGQAISPYTVGARALQVQTGVTYSGFQLGSINRDFIGAENVLRYGILENLELNVLHNFVTYNGFPDIYGLDAFHLGMRYHIYSGKGLIPSVGFQYSLKLRAVSRLFQSQATASKFVLVTQQAITDKLTLVTNNGLDWNGDNPQPQWFYVLNLSYPIGNRWGVFVENYGNAFADNFSTYFDGGISYLANPNFQIDLSGGGGQNQSFKEYFVSLGISWRIRHGQQ